MNRRAPKSEGEGVRFEHRTASAGSSRASRETTQTTPAWNAAEIFGAMVREVANNTRTIAELVREVRCLRQERQPAASAILEELCCAIYGAYGRQPFTAAEILDGAIGDVDDNTERLSEAVFLVTGPDPNPNTLARLLTRGCGTCGPWRLTSKGRANHGKRFRIEKLR